MGRRNDADITYTHRQARATLKRLGVEPGKGTSNLRGLDRAEARVAINFLAKYPEPKPRKKAKAKKTKNKEG